jgi:uncharacterized protein (TIGR02145 family)
MSVALPPTYPGSPDTYGSGSTWLPANDPCPDGWRVPTKAEWQSMINGIKDHGQMSVNGVSGMMITSKTSSGTMFLPFYEANFSSQYWSSTIVTDPVLDPAYGPYSYTLIANGSKNLLVADFERERYRPVNVRCVQK